MERLQLRVEVKGGALLQVLSDRKEGVHSASMHALLQPARALFSRLFPTFTEKLASFYNVSSTG